MEKTLFDFATEISGQSIAMTPAVDTLGRVIEEIAGTARTREDEILLFVLNAIYDRLVETGEHLDAAISRMHDDQGEKVKC